MIINRICLLAFAVFFIQNGYSMNRIVSTRLTMRHDVLGKKFAITKLGEYYKNISNLKVRTSDTDEEVVEILRDALQNIKNAFQIIETKWGEHGEMSESPTVQKAYCKRAFYDLYQSLHERFKDINSNEAAKIRDELKKLWIIE